MIAPIE